MDDGRKFLNFFDLSMKIYTKHEYMKIKLYNWTFQLPYFFNSSSTSFVSFRILDYIYEKRKKKENIEKCLVAYFSPFKVSFL